MSSTRLSTPKSVNACAGMGGDAREDVGQPGLRIEPFIFAVYAAQRTMPKGAVHPRLDLAGFDQVLDRAGRILDRHIRIDAMLIVEIDRVDLQPLTI